MEGTEKEKAGLAVLGAEKGVSFHLGEIRDPGRRPADS